MDSRKIKSLISEIAESVVSVAPDGWVEVGLNSVNVALFQKISAPVLLEGGEIYDNVSRISSSTMKAVRALREEMYESGKGTWYSMGIVVTKEGKYRVEYNYNEPLSVDLPIPDNYYALDLNFFPRDVNYIPEWVAKKIEKVNKKIERGGDI
ncbi:immunity protein YezG family protein [Nocardiopsis potens]|uniref:immunity protein YezG family protein n=1 Tax=Nocardiopsis potens TaxID=1246458 RepID=UPI0012685449|nr:immunity protein YezG family protein [Nocardiopsis potens]